MCPQKTASEAHSLLETVAAKVATHVIVFKVFFTARFFINPKKTARGMCLPGLCLRFFTKLSTESVRRCHAG